MKLFLPPVIYMLLGSAALAFEPPGQAARAVVLLPEVTLTPVRSLPLAIKMRGPTVAVLGDKVYLSLDENVPNVTGRTWTVYPQGTIGLDTHEDGRRADFSTRFTGDYIFFVSVSDPGGGNPAQVIHTLKILPPSTESSEEEPAEAPAPAPAGTAKMKAGVDPYNLIRTVTRQVQSPNRRTEGQQLARILRQTAGGLETGTITGVDPLVEVKSLATVALGRGAPNWAEWFKQTSELFRQLRAQHVLLNVGNYASALRNVAAELETQL